jgi:hypothetical protein
MSVFGREKVNGWQDLHVIKIITEFRRVGLTMSVPSSTPALPGNVLSVGLRQPLSMARLSL